VKLEVFWSVLSYSDLNL